MLKTNIHTCIGNMYTLSQSFGNGTLYLNRTILMNVIKIDGAQAGLPGVAAEKENRYKTVRLPMEN